jgi:hypothetical protein
MPDSLAPLVTVGLTFLFAGWVKGVVGMGLPTVAMATLGLFMPPVQAAALLVVPSLVTNLWQLVVGPALLALIRRLGSLMLCVCLGTFLGIGLLTSASSKWPSMALGAVLAIYATVALCMPRLSTPRRAEWLLSPAIGLITGMLTGATGVFVVPVVPYLSALDLGREELIQALGLSFTVSTLALATALAVSGRYPGALATSSTLAVVPALAGMLAGQWLRAKLDPKVFRRWFCRAMLGVGLFMLVRALLAG